MKYFSGFCLCNEKELFNDFLEDKEYVVAGFSKGAQDAVDFVLNSNERVDKLQLLSPAFFDYNKKLIDINLKAFKQNKKAYIEQFLKKAGLPDFNYVCECNEKELLRLFTFNWEKIKEIKEVKIEIFLGEYDKISASKKAYDFFKSYGDVYFIKKANHFLRS